MIPTYQFACPTAANTQALAAIIGAVVKGGEALEFKSDLGGGKTAFVKGLARGMGVSDVVQSPTFTVSQIHQAAGGLELHHFDFYRLNDPGIMRAELAESLAQPNAVVAIEWSDSVHDVLPIDRLTITLSAQANDSRAVSIAVPKKYEAIRKALDAYQKQGNLA